MRGIAMASQNVENALTYLAAGFRGDQEMAASLIGPGFMVANHAEGYRASTVEEQIEAAKGAASWTDRDFQVQRATEAIDRSSVVVQGVLSSTHTGGGWRGIPPTGKRVTLDACYILGFDRDGRIASHEVYEDHYTVLEQIGAVQLVDARGGST